MKRLKIGLAVTVLAGLATIISTASAGMFGSPPDGCANGIYQQYCGTQVDGTGLALAARGNTIVGTSNPGYGGSEDFFWFLYYGSPNYGNSTTNTKIAEFAPGGVASNEVMTLVNENWGHNSQYAVVLEPATGAANQQWVFSGGYWTNQNAPGLVLQTNGNNSPVSMVPIPGSQGLNQEFTWSVGQ
jgi:hypothetical protein